MAIVSTMFERVGCRIFRVESTREISFSEYEACVLAARTAGFMRNATLEEYFPVTPEMGVFLEDTYFELQQ